MNFKTHLVQEVYSDYEPPVNVKKTVQVLLEYVPPEDLAHLESIVLTNTAALSTQKEAGKKVVGGPAFPCFGPLLFKMEMGTSTY